MSRPRVEIHYCPGCHWLPRSAWMAQELLYTFGDVVGEVALCPASTPGVFCIRVDGVLVWDRVVDGGFPEVKELKRRVRDRVDPDRALGHVNR